MWSRFSLLPATLKNLVWTGTPVECQDLDLRFPACPDSSNGSARLPRVYALIFEIHSSCANLVELMLLMGKLPLANMLEVTNEAVKDCCAGRCTWQTSRSAVPRRCSLPVLKWQKTLDSWEFLGSVMLQMCSIKVNKSCWRSWVILRYTQLWTLHRQNDLFDG